MKLALVTIGQAPRVDLTGEVQALVPPSTQIVEHGALDELDDDDIAAIAPRPGEHALTSRLRAGGSAVFGHDQSVPLIESAIERAEDDGADASLLLCSGEFPAIQHAKPLFLTERLAHDGVRSLLSGLGSARLGVVRPLPEQMDDAADQWGKSIGLRPSALGAASCYTHSHETIAAAAAEVAASADLVVLDCIGFDEQMRAAAMRATGGTPVVTVRGVAIRLLASML